jgi:hypothetical protein
MTADKTIGDLVEVPPVKTVVRLEEGREASEEIAGTFVFTPEIAAHLNVVAEALQAGRGQGYFLQGDFGSGKSHLLAALYTWLSGRAGGEQLAAGHEALGRASASGRRILPVAVSLINYRAATSLEQILLEEAEKALAEAGHKTSLSPLAAFLDWLRAVLEDRETVEIFVGLAGTSAEGVSAAAPSAADLSDWISNNPRQAYAAGLRLAKKMGIEAPQALVEERRETFDRLMADVGAAGFDGLFLLIDELSEFFRSKPSSRSLNEDARTLQFLGELTGGSSLWIMAAVQESIERTGDIAQSILRKIKDRFPVRLTLSTMHIRSLISERLVVKKPGAEEEIYGIYEHYRRQFSTFSRSFEELRTSYPVHPTTISLLDGLGTLFSQHRGIVDFVHARIAGDSRRGIPPILDRPAHELLGPDSIYEHFSERLAEFSSYHIYPRHIIPRLDREIEGILENGEDRYLAKRLVRMLVLYRIHPAAETPNAAMLAELAACSLGMPEMNSRFISEALLDPLSSSSRFLSKKSNGDPDKAVYEISTEEDPGKVLEARIRRMAGELEARDSRLLLEPLLQLPESDSWPGSSLARAGIVREISWTSSRRRVLVRLLHRDEKVPDRLISGLESGDYDFAVLLSMGEAEVAGEHIAVWEVPSPEHGENLEALKYYLAVRLALEELSPANPAQAPLIPVARERLNRSKPAAVQAAMDTLFAGRFSDSRIKPDAAIRQLKRFDRLLETAGEVVLADRYPRFAEVAPRRYVPSPRIYQQLLESFIIPGSLSLREARSRSLGAAIDGLAVPLGLVELKRGSYLYSPDTSGHPLLSFLFGQLSPAGSVPLHGLLAHLRQGVFGLPKDTALFLLASLAAGGLITIRKGGRAMALEFLNLKNLERAEEIALGELISDHDRTTLQEECGFLGSAGGWESFGLRQQREAWQEVIRFRDTAEKLAGETLSRLRQRREYSSFKNFPFDTLEEKLDAAGRLAGDIKVSYAAKEGLEKFLSSWRASGLSGENIQLLQKLDGFLRRGAEKFVFINHYVRHEAVEKAGHSADGLELQRVAILEMLEEPDQTVVPDEAAELDRRFAALREHYTSLYAGLHQEYYESLLMPELSKNATRALVVLKRLAGIDALDKPPGLDRFLMGMASRGLEQCHRQIREELMRGPVCGCGFLPGQAASPAQTGEPEKEIDRYLSDYLGILKSPGVMESLSAHAYALEDLKPRISEHLRALVVQLEAGSLKASGLVGSLDEAIGQELSKALAGRMIIKRASLEELVIQLAGRRLPPEKILAIVSRWLGESEGSTLVAVESDRSTGDSEEPLDWWALFNTGFFPRLSSRKDRERLTEKLEALLEERYPSSRLLEPLKSLDREELVRFICSERLHTRSIQAAWVLLAEGVLRGGDMPSVERRHSTHVDKGRAGEIEGRLRIAAKIAEELGKPFPERLAFRMSLETLLSDPWSTEELEAEALETFTRVKSLGESWLAEKDPVEPIRLEERPLVLLIDGVPPDVWLIALDRIEAGEGRPSISWARLATDAETVAATAYLLDVAGDPADALAAHGVPYLLLGGSGETPAAEQAASLDPGKAAVIRLGVLDRGAHLGTYKLSEMAAMVDHILARELPILHRYCSRQKRPLILTTDHGLSLGMGRLGHGKGGIYERAIFRAVWGY